MVQASKEGGTPRPSDQGPGSPSQLSVQSWREALRSAGRHMKTDRISVAAGAFAYRWFLSLFPAVIALLGLAALISIPRHVTVSLVHGVTKALPPGAAGVLAGAISQATRRTGGAATAIVLAAAVALWSATSGMVMVEEGLDMAYEAPGDRSFIQKRLMAVPLLVGAGLLGGAASALIVFGPQLGSAIRGAAPVGGTAFSVGWTAARWVVALVLIVVLLSFLYYLAPNRERPRWQWVTPGSLAGTAIWAVVSLGFSYYTASFGSYGKTYGAFAGVAILIFWLYLTGLAILLGGEVNAAFEREAAAQGASATGLQGRESGPPLPSPGRPAVGAGSGVAEPPPPP